jgi:hypothetical protein
VTEGEGRIQSRGEPVITIGPATSSTPASTNARPDVQAEPEVGMLRGVQLLGHLEERNER